MMSEDEKHDDAPEAAQDLTEELNKISNLDVAQLLKELKLGQLQELLAKSRMGILTHQEHAIIAKILRDNGLVFPDGGFGADQSAPNQTHNEGAKPIAEPKKDLDLPVFNDDEKDFE